MTDCVHLAPESLEAIAQRVAELLRGEPTELIDAAEVARRFTLSRDYVYEHAAELGAVRIGSGPKARLRFDPAIVRERMTGLSVQSRSEPQQENRSPVRRGRKVTLLPIRGESP